MPDNNTKLYIGSDPEFVFASPIDDGFIPANDILNDPGNNHTIGCDGHSSTGELRPHPETDPLKHAENIFKLLAEAKNSRTYKKILELNMYSSSREESIGGHIHLGHPNLTPNHPGNSELIKQICKSLDFLLAFPLMFVEIPEHAKRRKESEYGRMSDYRGQQWGFEYRTAPSWLASRELTESVLCLAYAVARQVIESNWRIKKSIGDISGFYDMYQRHNLEILKPFLSQARFIVKHQLEDYSKYKTKIDYLFYNAAKRRPLIGQEIKSGWKIPYIMVKNIMLYTVKELVERMSQVLPIPKSTDKSWTNFITHKSRDFQVPEIARNINQSLCQIITSSTLNSCDRSKCVYIYGRKLEAGDVITLELFPGIMTTEKANRLAKILRAIIRDFGYIVPVKIELKELEPETIMKHSDHNFEMPTGSNFLTSYTSAASTIIPDYMWENNIKPPFVARVGLGRKIREQNNYLAEAIILTVLIYVNDTIYQSYKINRVTGDRIYLPIMPNMLLTHYKRNLASQQKNFNHVVPASEEDGI